MAGGPQPDPPCFLHSKIEQKRPSLDVQSVNTPNHSRKPTFNGRTIQVKGVHTVYGLFRTCNHKPLVIVLLQGKIGNLDPEL